jgi:hypothetical protein
MSEVPLYDTHLVSERLKEEDITAGIVEFANVNPKHYTIHPTPHTL